MAKEKTLYYCTKCDSQFKKWSGQCFECNSWGTVTKYEQTNTTNSTTSTIKPDILDPEIKSDDTSKVRIDTSIDELNRVFGGGIVPGSLILLGGEPGIGKSTLLLQLSNAIKDTLYVSGEESKSQVSMRLKRLGLKKNEIKFISQTNTDIICNTIKKEKPQLVIIDSIQTIFTKDINSEPGNVSQVKACTVKLLETAKNNNISIVIVGHVTKDGNVAGPKTLEHLVDTVLYLEGDSKHMFRILRGVKNRFGSTNELGVFEMTGSGLIEVDNPSKLFLEGIDQNIPGSIVTVLQEGNRSFLVEIQALINKTAFGMPQRKASGYDNNRLQLLLAVLGKRLNLPFAQMDVYLNIIGGLQVKEVSIDLAICMSLISALKDTIIDTNSVAVGEVGLGGEIRPIPFIEQRIKEASKLGFEKIYIPKSQVKKTKNNSITIIGIGNLNELIKRK